MTLRPLRLDSIFSGLPRRDFILLPAIVLATILLCVATPEIVLGMMFSEGQVGACFVPDSNLGSKARPNCKFRYKLPETAWIENRYNDCGYRTRESCGPVQPGTIRAAVVGSSTAAGNMVAYDQSFAAIAPAQLAHKCGRPVQFQNLAGVGYHWVRLQARAAEALSLKPDLLITMITPYDIEQPRIEQPRIEEQASLTGQASPGLAARLANAFRDSTIWFGAQYYRAAWPDQYLHFYLRRPERSGYLTSPLSPLWRERADATIALLHSIDDMARRANVPMVVVYVPLRAQAMLLARRRTYPDLSPMALDDVLADAVRTMGGDFVDMDDVLKALPDVTPEFFQVNDHLTPLGHAVLAKQLVANLVDTQKPIFGACADRPGS